MTTSAVPNCVSPLLFELEDDESLFAPYSIGGSGFLARFRDRYYFVAAGHCLKGNSYNALRIPVAPGVQETLQFEHFGRVNFPEWEDDPDHGDFALLSLPSEFSPSNLPGALEAVDVPETPTWDLLNPKFMLTLRGYPYAAPETRIIPECGAIRTQALECDAHFCGEAIVKYCYVHKFIDSRPISDSSGMSGSPVFAKIPYNGEPYYVLVGVHIREGWFLSIEAVKEGLRQFSQ